MNSFISSDVDVLSDSEGNGDHKNPNSKVLGPYLCIACSTKTYETVLFQFYQIYYC